MPPDDALSDIIWFFRAEATRKVSGGAGLDESKAAIDGILRNGVSIHNGKAVARLTSNSRRVLGERLLSTTATKGSRRLCVFLATLMVVEPETLKIVDLEVYVEPARGSVWMYEEACRVTRHAAGRFIERCGEAEVSLARIAASAVLTLRFVRQLRRSQDLTARVVPVPDVEAKMIAIVDVTEGAVITYVNREKLGPAREVWVAKLDAYDQSVKGGEAVIETRAKSYAALLNEGARIWAETHERHGVAA